jgi:prepilin-type N-terminal cleavage/methylation domain-containing protein
MNAITSWDEVPPFDSEEAEAAFWEANRIDLRLMDSSVAAAQEPTESITISLRMDPRMLARLKRLARSRYLNYQSMMKQWLSERLEEEFRERRAEDVLARPRAAAFRAGRASAAFTLIELLVVIAIIGVLAGLVVGLAPVMKRRNTETRVQTELRQIETALENYKSEFNAYPPDALVPGTTPPRSSPVRNPLFYELLGTRVAGSGNTARFIVAGGDEFLTPTQIQELFGRPGFRNAVVDQSEARKPFIQLRDAQVKRLRYGGDASLSLLAVPAPWPRAEANPLLTLTPAPANTDAALVNPWRYVSTNPTNNPGAFDLWAEVFIGREKKIIGNFLNRP